MFSKLGIDYDKLTSSCYARGLLTHVRKTYEPAALIDKLICSAYIEARSQERFAAIAPYVDERLGQFYVSLLRSEARHYQDYLTLAQQFSDEDISDRVNFFGAIERELIQSPDADFKFHSGSPQPESIKACAFGASHRISRPPDLCPGACLGTTHHPLHLTRFAIQPLEQRNSAHLNGYRQA